MKDIVIYLRSLRWRTELLIRYYHGRLRNNCSEYMSKWFEIETSLFDIAHSINFMTDEEAYEELSYQYDIDKLYKLLRKSDKFITFLEKNCIEK